MLTLSIRRSDRCKGRALTARDLQIERDGVPIQDGIRRLDLAITADGINTADLALSVDIAEVDLDALGEIKAETEAVRATGTRDVDVTAFGDEEGMAKPVADEREDDR